MKPAKASEDPADVLDHAPSEIASGSKPGSDATKKIPGEGLKRPRPPLIKMDAAWKRRCRSRSLRGSQPKHPEFQEANQIQHALDDVTPRPARCSRVPS